MSGGEGGQNRPELTDGALRYCSRNTARRRDACCRAERPQRRKRTLGECQRYLPLFIRPLWRSGDQSGECGLLACAAGRPTCKAQGSIALCMALARRLLKPPPIFSREAIFPGGSATLTKLLAPALQCPRNLIVYGTGGWGANPATANRMRWAAVNERHDVTFCGSATGPTNFNPPVTEYTVSGQAIRCPVYAERDVAGSCIFDQTLAQATTAAAARTSHVCTANELIFACGRGSGCQHDTDMIWSSTVSASLYLGHLLLNHPVTLTPILKTLNRSEPETNQT